MKHISFFLIFIFIFVLSVQAQQRDNTINVVNVSGAKGDGIMDDTQAINSAITLAYSQKKDIYFPPGIYLINDTLKVKDGVSLYGDYDGLSVIMSSGAPQVIGEMTWNVQLSNINIEDLHFLNISLLFGKGNFVKNYAISRCIFMANNPAFNETDQINWQYIEDGVVEHNIFLRQSNCRGAAGLSFYKTTNCMVRENVWGLDMNQTDWLATEWRGYSSWHNLLNKLQTLSTNFGLDWDQGQFKCAYYPNRVIDEKIYDNIFNGSPYFVSTHELNRDHVIYTKDFQNIEIVGNWMRGWPMEANGGLKMRNAYGPGIVAANHFVNTPVLQYTYDQPDVPKVYQNILLYRNWFDIDNKATFDRLGLSYWEDAGIGDDVNIEYDMNIYNCNPGVGDIHLGKGSNPNEQHVYPTNFYSDSTTLIPIYGGSGLYAVGKPDSARNAPFANYSVPFYNIPEYRIVSSVEAGSFVPIPTDISLSQNYPNPFNPTTNLKYSIPVAGSVIIQIYNSLGQLVNTLVDEYKNPGDYSTTWNGRNMYSNEVTSGVYFCKIVSNNYTQTKKMMLIK